MPVLIRAPSSGPTTTYTRTSTSSTRHRAMPTRMHHTLNPTHRAKSNHPIWLHTWRFRLAGGWGRRRELRTSCRDTCCPPHHPNAGEKNHHARGRDPKLGIASIRPVSYPVLPMAAREKISITVSTDLLWSVKAQQKSTGQNRSAVIEDCIRAKLTDTPDEEPDLTRTYIDPGFGVTRDEFDSLEARISEIERVAQQNGAM